MTDFRALCAELLDEAICLGQLPYEQDPGSELVDRARAALAQPEPQGLTDEEIADEARKYLVNEYALPAEITYLLDPDNPEYEATIGCFRAVLARWGSRAQPEPQGPTDEELLELMPESMRDEFYVARICSDAMGRRVKPGIFRVALNTAALEYARAALDRWGQDQQNKETTND